MDGKRSIRAIKNRQAAQASRERHRRYVETLEAEREALLTHSTELSLRVAQLELDKAKLALELESLRHDLLQVKTRLLVGETNVEEKASFSLPSSSLSPLSSSSLSFSSGPAQAPCQHSPSTLPHPDGHLLVLGQAAPLPLPTRWMTLTTPPPPAPSMTSSRSSWPRKTRTMLVKPQPKPKRSSSSIRQWRRMARGLVKRLARRYSLKKQL